MFDERELRHPSGMRLAAHQELDRRPDLGEVDGDVTHGHRSADGGAKTAAGDLPDDGAGGVAHLGVRPGWHLAVRN